MILASLIIFVLVNSIQIILLKFSCSQRTTLEDDVYNFGFILFESLVGTIASEKGESFFLNEKVRRF